MVKPKIKQSVNDRIFTVINYAFLFAAFIVVFYPILYIISSSFSSTRAIMAGQVWLLPIDPTLIGYEAVFNNPQIISGYGNSIINTAVGTLVNVVMTVMAAYPLSRHDFVGRNVIVAMFTFTMLFSGGLIPNYLLIRDLHLMDTRWALIIPGAIGVWNVIIARTFFQSTIPNELYEAAELDGASDLDFLFKIVVPLSGPIIAVLTLFYAVGHWNSYFDALIYLRSVRLYPLQIILRNILVMNEIQGNMTADVDAMMRLQGMADLLRYSLIVVASVPVLLIYPFVQRFFVKGVMVGALKG